MIIAYNLLNSPLYSEHSNIFRHIEYSQSYAIPLNSLIGHLDQCLEEEIRNYMSLKLIDKTSNRFSPPIFILCDKCYWCATYLDKTRIPIDNTCSQCNADNTELSSFPILSESFTLHYKRRGIELDFD